jgi:hypothetical protein
LCIIPFIPNDDEEWYSNAFYPILILQFILGENFRDYLFSNLFYDLKWFLGTKRKLESE